MALPLNACFIDWYTGFFEHIVMTVLYSTYSDIIHALKFFEKEEAPFDFGPNGRGAVARFPETSKDTLDNLCEIDSTL